MLGADKNSMSLENITEHLEDLRRRIMYVLAFFLIALIGSLVFVGNVYNYLVTPLQGMKLVVLGPGEVVQIYLTIAGVAAIAVTTPFLLWQLWVFVGPGLLAHERRYALRLIGPITVMFLLGVAFAYYVIFPEIFHFLRQIAEIRFTVMFTASEYFSFMFAIVVPFGLLFELPIVVMFLTRIGVITPMWLRSVRRYAYFLCVILGVFISPPELISHLSVVVPMILVYEISIGISALTYKRKLAAEAWWREKEQQEAPDVADSPAITVSEAKEAPIEPLGPRFDPQTDPQAEPQTEPLEPISDASKEAAKDSTKGRSEDSQPTQTADRERLPNRPEIDVEDRE